MVGKWMGALAALALAGCAHGGAEPQNTFDLAAGGGGMTVTCDMSSCKGPEVQIIARGDELRGSLGNRAFDVRTSDTQVRGSVGAEPVELTVKPENGGLAINGMFAGQLGSLSVNPLEIQGRVGQCSYDLQSSGDGAYSGQRSCGRAPVPTTVRVPAVVQNQPQGRRAALLALLLAG